MHVLLSRNVSFGCLLMILCARPSMQSSPMGGPGGYSGYVHGGGNSFYNPQNQQRQNQYQASQQQVYGSYQHEYEQQQQQQQESAAVTEEKEEEKAPLPPGWTEYTDPESGNPYYYNEADGITTWERPDPPVADESSSRTDNVPEDNSSPVVEEETVSLHGATSTSGGEMRGDEAENPVEDNASSIKLQPHVEPEQQQQWEIPSTTTPQVSDNMVTTEEPSSYGGYDGNTVQEERYNQRIGEKEASQEQPTAGYYDGGSTTEIGKDPEQEQPTKRTPWGFPSPKGEPQIAPKGEPQIPPQERLQQPQHQFQSPPGVGSIPNGQEPRQGGFGGQQERPNLGRPQQDERQISPQEHQQRQLQSPPGIGSLPNGQEPRQGVFGGQQERPNQGRPQQDERQISPQEHQQRQLQSPSGRQEVQGRGFGTQEQRPNEARGYPPQHQHGRPNEMNGPPQGQQRWNQPQQQGQQEEPQKSWNQQLPQQRTSPQQQGSPSQQGTDSSQQQRNSPQQRPGWQQQPRMPNQRQQLPPNPQQIGQRAHPAWQNRQQQQQSSPYNPYNYGQPGQQTPQQYGQPGQQQPYGQYGQPGQQQLVPSEETTSAVKEALGSAWQGLLGFKNRTKEALTTAKDTVVSKASVAGEKIGSTSSSLLGQARSGVSALFENNEDPSQQQQQQQPYNMGMGSRPMQQQQPPPGYGSYPPQYGQPPMQPRSNVPYPHQGQSPQQYPPRQTQWQGGRGGPPQQGRGPAQQQGRGPANRYPPQQQQARSFGGYPPRFQGGPPQQQGGRPGQQQGGQQRGQPQQQQRPPNQKPQLENWQHPGLTGEF